MPSQRKPTETFELDPAAKAKLPRYAELRERVAEQRRQADARWQPPDRPPPLPHQQPPEGDWQLWVLEAGRGAGKTEACSRYFARHMRRFPGSRGRIIAPTFGDAVEACIHGPSGLQSIDPEAKWMPSAPGGAKVVWPNGSEALVLGTPTAREVERLRAGGNRSLDWWEEMAANTQLESAWDQAQLGLRMGDHPHSIGSTTPRSTAAYRKIRRLPGVVLTHARMEDNPHNSPAWRKLMEDRYGGTRLGRQEIAGELIEDSERALVRREWIESQRVDEAPMPLIRLRAIGLDPGGEGSQAMVQVGTGLDHNLYVERSEMVQGTATDFLRHAVTVATGAHNEYGGAPVLVVEKNHGGDYLTELLAHVMRERGAILPVKTVWASAGKRTRAEPAAMLIEQGKVKWVGGHSALEDEWCQTDWDAESPHLADAMVWAVDSLTGSATIGHEEELSAIPWPD